MTAIAPPVFGPSGLLRERIEHGEPADLLASADMDQPRILARQRSGRAVVMFTRNRLCALGRVRLGLTQDNLLEKLLAMILLVIVAVIFYLLHYVVRAFRSGWTPPRAPPRAR